VKKESARNANWGAMSAFGSSDYREALTKINKPSAVIKQNNHTGVSGRAGLIKSSIKDKDKEPKLFHKRQEE